MATTTEEEEGDGEGVIYDYDEELKRKWAKELDSKAAATNDEIASHSASVMSAAAAAAEKKHTNYLDNYNLDDPIDRLAKKINDVLYMLENTPDQIIIAAKSASLNRDLIDLDKTRRTLEFQSKLINSLK